MGRAARLVNLTKTVQALIAKDQLAKYCTTYSTPPLACLGTGAYLCDELGGVVLELGRGVVGVAVRDDDRNRGRAAVPSEPRKPGKGEGGKKER